MFEIAVVISILLAAALGLVGALLYRSMRIRTRNQAVKAHLETLSDRIDRLAERIPDHRDLEYCEFPPIEASATIEAWLLQDKPKNALVAATHAVNKAPKDGRGYLHLARTLLLCDELEFAAKALVRARELGEDSPAYDYLEARLRLSLARLRDGKDKPPPGPEVLAALELLLDVVEKDPSFGDAAYHAGLLAIQLGLEEEGRNLIAQVRPLMEGSPERGQYLKDLERFN